MRSVIFLVALVGFISAQMGYVTFQTPSDVKPGYTVVGGATFATINSTHLNVTVVLAGITGVNASVPHGIHVHATGDLTNSTTVGGHLSSDPNNAHACEDNVNRHLGDMGNWVTVNGAISMWKALDRLKLSDVLGKAVVVHSFTDPCAGTAYGARVSFGVVTDQKPDAITTGSATFQTPSDVSPGFTVVGGATFTNYNATHINVSVTLSGISGVNASVPHGVHVHSTGDLTNSTTVGGHLNPNTSNAHACEDNANRHLGDMGNWETVNGTINTWKLLDRLRLSDVLGRAVVVHSITDPCAGSVYGARVSFGVVYPQFPAIVLPTSSSASNSNGATATTNSNSAGHVAASVFVVLASILALF